MAAGLPREAVLRALHTLRRHEENRTHIGHRNGDVFTWVTRTYHKVDTHYWSGSYGLPSSLRKTRVQAEQLLRSIRGP